MAARELGRRIQEAPGMGWIVKLWNAVKGYRAIAIVVVGALLAIATQFGAAPELLQALTGLQDGLAAENYLGAFLSLVAALAYVFHRLGLNRQHDELVGELKRTRPPGGDEP
jgi:hypothetical protein